MTARTRVNRLWLPEAFIKLAEARMDSADIVKMKICIVRALGFGARRTALTACLADDRPVIVGVGAVALGAPEMLAEVEVTVAE